MTNRESELAAEGWQKKSTADEPRLSELVEAYRRIGFKVHLEPCDPAQQPGCNQCLQAAAGRYQTIYIRPTASGEAAEGDPVAVEPKTRFEPDRQGENR